MPGPAPVAVYVVAAVVTVAAAAAFKEFVYEPHIAPRVERWAEEFLAKRKAMKMKRAVPAVPVPSAGAGEAASVSNESTYELENLVADEVAQWRNEVIVSRDQRTSTIRRRQNAGASSEPGTPLDESNVVIPYSPLTPTHVIFDPADGLSASSPTSTISSRVATPSPHSTLSHSTFRTPPPPAVRAPPTPDPSARGASPTGPTTDPYLFSVGSPHNVPSLSLSHPVDLDAEHDLELLSAPSESSSRPSSPFSELSQPAGDGDEQFHSFTLSPQSMTLSASDSGSGSEGDDLERWSNAGSEISGSSWASTGAQN
ncbi:hypothetical protein GGX14DRAFT_451235 [Mycena pura]|uniref:Transmembrane protein n=1 Tax=Mycena pura TaxID=153505 RepID=A0AAD6VKV5_9AGAR|nr:hypothetical protein GGX14DRAFT_451235 [Mycena pura]